MEELRIPIPKLKPLIMRSLIPKSLLLKVRPFILLPKGLLKVVQEIIRAIWIRFINAPKSSSKSFLP